MSEKKQIPVPLHEVIGLPVTEFEDNPYADEVTIVLGDVTITIQHSCCGCCDGGYLIESNRPA